MLGKRLAAARKRAGLSQFQLVLELGKRYDRTMIGHVEHNRLGLQFDGAVNAARKLGVSLDNLAGLTDYPTPSSELAEKVSELTDDEALTAKTRELPGIQPIAVYRIKAVAGGGALDLDEEVKTYADFRHDWLSRKGLTPSRCSIIDVMGQSMEPTLPDGCVILLHRNRTQRYPDHIFVVRTEDELIVKRAGKDKDGWQLVSDHPSWKPTPWPDGAEVIGEVKRMAREL